MRVGARAAYGIDTYYNNSRGLRWQFQFIPPGNPALSRIDRAFIGHRGYFVLRRTGSAVDRCGFLTNPAEAFPITDSPLPRRAYRGEP